MIILENASKALLMAGAILIAVMIISLFMWFINVLGNYGNKQALEVKQTEIESFNRYFYYSNTGNRISGADYINLVKKARDANRDNDTYFITINGLVANLDGMTDANFNSYVAGLSDNFLLTQNINYSIGYDGNTGRINRINFSI